jgi:poly-gamma-glutamate capsule biosynthesis protein CapA/YwtB (metallophosphatase superfamily)
LLGDVMLGRGVAEALGRVRPEEVWAPELREVARSCDVVICNLECCISTRGKPTERIPGKPFFFRAPPPAVESLRSMRIGVAGLANNHALDYEEEALADTLEALRGAGIAVAGAGADGSEARRGAIVDLNGRRVGLVAVSDHPGEFAAGDGVPGIAYEDLARELPDWLLGELGRLRGECDWVIAVPHWGPNMTASPAAWQRRAAQLLQEAGADVVAGHSAHAFHGVGWGARGPLLYDLGDALDDYAVDPTLRNDLGVMALWKPGEGGGLELIALRLDFCHTRLASGDDAEWIARRLDRACESLGTRAERVSEHSFDVAPA